MTGKNLSYSMFSGYYKQPDKTREAWEGGWFNFRVAFSPIGKASIELIHTTAKTGLAADLLRKRGEGIHHIAFEMEDLEKTFHEFRSRRIDYLWDGIIDGSRGSKVAFLKAEELNRVYIEVMQKC